MTEGRKKKKKREKRKEKEEEEEEDQKQGHYTIVACVGIFRKSRTDGHTNTGKIVMVKWPLNQPATPPSFFFTG